ncbi:hypothetical protein RYX36_021203 [Vicia faba]
MYMFHMRKEQSCTVTCHQPLDVKSAKNFKEKIDDEYRVNMVLDNLPVAVLRQRRDGSQSTTYEHGFHVGFKGNYQGSKEEKYFINNHVSFRVMYHKDPETGSACIVGFEVTPTVTITFIFDPNYPVPPTTLTVTLSLSQHHHQSSRNGSASSFFTIIIPSTHPVLPSFHLLPPSTPSP